MAGLAATWKGIADGEERRELVSNFIGGWIPADGGEAAGVVLSMPADLRREFLGKLLEGYPRVHLSWTDEFTRSLLNSHLGEFEPRREEFTREAARTGQAAGDLFYARRDDQNYRFEDKPGSDPKRAIKIAVERYLKHEMDFPLLLAENSIGISEIESRLIAEMPDLARHKAALGEALVAELFAYHPEKTMVWGNRNLEPELLAKRVVEQ